MRLYIESTHKGSNTTYYFLFFYIFLSKKIDKIAECLNF